jgi:PleD family two-component response regulator
MPRKKILLVDDAETVLMMERMILNKSYDLMVAKNGEEAVAKAAQELPDLILMDVVMPKMNGFQACQQIRQRESTSGIPIIMVTTRSEAENMEKGFEHGCNDYVTKPMNSLELLSKVKNYIGE